MKSSLTQIAIHNQFITKHPDQLCLVSFRHESITNTSKKWRGKRHTMRSIGSVSVVLQSKLESSWGHRRPRA